MPVNTAPRSLCLLRLSALGDATHALALVRALQRGMPGLAITWIIGKGEARLLEGLDGVEFIVFDKKAGLAGFRELRGKLAGRRFDVLLHLQLALRAGLASTLVRADRRIGFDRARSKEGHSLFINERIAAGGHHVLDAHGQGLGSRQSFVGCDDDTLGGMDAAMRLYERSGFRRLDAPLGDTGHGGCNTFYLLDL